MATLTLVWCYAHSLYYHRHNHPKCSPASGPSAAPPSSSGESGPSSLSPGNHRYTIVFIIDFIMNITIMNITIINIIIIFSAFPLCLDPIPLKLATLAPSLSCSMITRLRWLSYSVSYTRHNFVHILHHILFILS